MDPILGLNIKSYFYLEEFEIKLVQDREETLFVLGSWVENSALGWLH